MEVYFLKIKKKDHIRADQNSEKSQAPSEPTPNAYLKID